MNYTYNNGKDSCTFSDEDKQLNDTVYYILVSSVKSNQRFQHLNLYISHLFFIRISGELVQLGSGLDFFTRKRRVIVGDLRIRLQNPEACESQCH